MATPQRTVMDIEDSTSFTVGQSDEHQRRWSEKKWEQQLAINNYDRSRTPLNFEVEDGKVVPVDTSRTIPDRIMAMLKRRGVKYPNTPKSKRPQRVVANVIFGGSTPTMRRLAFGDQVVDYEKGATNPGLKRMPDIERWAVEAYKFACEKWGKDNIVSFVVHMDESWVHAHCTMVPVVGDKISYKKMFHGASLPEMSQHLKSLHDEYAKFVNQFGLRRGNSMSHTGSGHVSTEEYRRRLSSECTDLEETIEEQKAMLRQLKGEVKQAETRVKGLTTMVRNLESQRDDMEREITRLNKELTAGRGDTEQLQQRIAELEKQHKEVLTALTDKRAKLTVANRTLAEYKQLEDESRERNNELRQQSAALRQEVREAARDLSQQMQFRVNDAAIGGIIREVQSIFPQLGITPDMLDDTLLGDIAAHGVNLFKCAGMLFGGYVDSATTFAQGCGGGGGSTGGWGRKEDEDDLAFSRRCLFQAAKMMRPSGGHSIKRK